MNLYLGFTHRPSESLKYERTSKKHIVMESKKRENSRANFQGLHSSHTKEIIVDNLARTLYPRKARRRKLSYR
jgi:hypothetical protein